MKHIYEDEKSIKYIVHFLQSFSEYWLKNFKYISIGSRSCYPLHTSYTWDFSKQVRNLKLNDSHRRTIISSYVCYF